MEMIECLNETGQVVANQQVSLPSTSNDSILIKPDPNELKMEQRSNHQISLLSISTSNHASTYIKLDPDKMEYDLNRTCQAVSNQRISLPSQLKCEVKEEMMYCQFCPYSDVDFGKLKFHTFKQHPTGAAVVKFGDSNQDFKFFCVKETCDFSTTVCTVYEEHLMNCCPLNQTLSGEVKERLKSTLQFVLDFHNNHCLSDATGLLEYFISFNKTFTSEDVLLGKHMEHNDLFSAVSKSSSLSDVQSSLICKDVRERNSEGPFSSFQYPIPIFIVQNQNTSLNENIESQTNISKNLSTSIRKQLKNNEWLLKTGPSVKKNSKSKIHTHMKMETGKGPSHCVNCDKYFKYRSTFVRHLKIHSGEKPFKCSVCNKAFAYSNILIEHKRTHTGEKPFKCDVCYKEFTRSGDLIVHKRKHTGEKPFKCDVCYKGFTRSGDLLIHKRTHTGEKPFKCDVCSKAFSQSHQLIVHKRIHTGEKPFKCDVCDKYFSQSQCLTDHKRIHTGEKPFSCHECDRRFSNSSNFHRHMKLHSGEKPFLCDVCHLGFTRSSHLRTHKRKHHEAI